jgi:Raf kinase inhibitor-like YbhB/YbcL family protein
VKLISPAFKEFEYLPSIYTGDGDDLSPPLEWLNLPEKCRSIAIVCEDLDSISPMGRKFPFVHWLIYNLSPDTSALAEGVITSEFPGFPDGAAQGKNSFGKIGYNGPLLPLGAIPHRYVFSLYALRKELDLDPGLTKPDLVEEMRGEILGIARLFGTYERLVQKTG